MTSSHSTEIHGAGLPASDRALRTLVFVTMVAVVAAAVAALLPRLEMMSLRRGGVVAFALALIAAAAAAKLLKETLLVGWIVALTLFRPYSSLVGVFGLEGLYWLPADVAFAALYAIWAAEVIVLKRPLIRQGPAVWPWVAPFLLACALSASQAANTDWAAAELIRVARVIPIFVYCRYNLGLREWRLCLAALGIAVLLQAALGGLQVTTGKMLPAEIDGSRRAEGTMMHPNILADYLLLLFPAALAVTFCARSALVRFAALAVAAAAGGAIVITLSRIPWALLVTEVLLVGLALVVARLLSLKVFVGLCAAGAVCAIIAAAPFMKKIEQRIKGNFSESIRFRAELNEVAGLVFEQSPFIGVGLNNLSDHIFDIARRRGYHDLLLNESDWQADQEAAEESAAVVRRVTVHNLYLFLLAETGAIGAICLLLYLFSAAGTGLVVAARALGATRALCIGFTVGIVAVMVHNLAEIAFWMDTVLQTFALVFAMLAAVPGLTFANGGECLLDSMTPAFNNIKLQSLVGGRS